MYISSQGSGSDEWFGCVGEMVLNMYKGKGKKKNPGVCWYISYMTESACTASVSS